MTFIKPLTRHWQPARSPPHARAGRRPDYGRFLHRSAARPARHPLPTRSQLVSAPTLPPLRLAAFALRNADAATNGEHSASMGSGSLRHPSGLACGTAPKHAGAAILLPVGSASVPSVPEPLAALDPHARPKLGPDSAQPFHSSRSPPHTMSMARDKRQHFLTFTWP